MIGESSQIPKDLNRKGSAFLKEADPFYFLLKLFEQSDLKPVGLCAFLLVSMNNVTQR